MCLLLQIVGLSIFELPRNPIQHHVHLPIVQQVNSHHFRLAPTENTRYINYCKRYICPNCTYIRFAGISVFCRCSWSRLRSVVRSDILLVLATFLEFRLQTGTFVLRFCAMPLFLKEVGEIKSYSYIYKDALHLKRHDCIYLSINDFLL